MRALSITLALASLTGCVLPSESPDSNAVSYETDGTKLKDWCSTPEMAPACFFYISGVLDGASVQAELSESKQPYCPPEGTQYAQAIDVVTQYLNNHPLFLQKNANLLITYALLNAYPCKG